MCGIVGIFDPLSKFQNKKKIIRDLNIIQTHRGPDDQGYYDDNLTSLGFRRLSIIDLINGNQPIIKNNIITIFNIIQKFRIFKNRNRIYFIYFNIFRNSIFIF